MKNQEKTYSLKKCKKILHHLFSFYRRKKKKLQEFQQKRLESLLSSLQDAIQKKDTFTASSLAKESEKLFTDILPKNFFDKMLDFGGSLLFALAVAVVVRQLCFEFYIIPSGSMRPTLMEKDYLVVSKSDFGVNTLGRTGHYYFDSSLAKRGNVIVFSGDKMDIPKVDTTYFLLFPGKKQYVKRLIGKPGDILYFYGGQIYGLDKEGNEIQDFKERWFETIEHIPFLRFEGKTTSTHAPVSSFVFYQFGKPIARLTHQRFGEMQGEMFPFPTQLVKDPHAIKHYYEIWGLQNFATAYILLEQEALAFHPKERSAYYLLLNHHPDLQSAPLSKDFFGQTRAALSISSSLLPLSEQQMEKILQHVTTSRFVVKNKKAFHSGTKSGSYSPTLDVPDGTYEFIDGKAYAIHAFGISFQLSPSHPLYRKDPSQIATLYNFGVEWMHYPGIVSSPSRYAYFRNGELFLMGHALFSKEELSSFVQEEKEKALTSNYTPFLDKNPPMTADGKLDKELIQKYGLVIPPESYLALGDNHCMSSDSRDFGFVPEANLRGKASWIFWPLGHFGKIAQPSTTFFSLPHLIVWGGLIVIGIGSYTFYRRYLNRPIKF